MLCSGIRPDRFSFSYIIRAFLGTAKVRDLHGQVFRYGFSSDVFIQNGLVGIYAKFPCMEIAKKVFEEMLDKDRDVVSWTCVISGFVQSGNSLEAIEFFYKMRSSEHAVVLDFVSVVSVLKACAHLRNLRHGKALHGLVVKYGFDEEDDVRTSLIAFYSQCGEPNEARAVFDLAVNCKSLLVWNSMISGYAKNGDPLEAINLFRELTIYTQINPDSITLRAMIMAVSRLGSLEIAKQVHLYVRNKEFNRDMIISTALIDMYGKCGSIDRACEVFDEMPEKDVVAWSAIISGYSLHGRGHEAIALFHKMQLSGVTPNSVTFLSLLSACNHSGLVSEGCEIFAAMRACGVELLPRHYACMIDLLGRSGMLTEARGLMAEMSEEPTTAAWGAILSACRSLGDVPTGELAAEKVLELDPLNVGHLVQLSNLFAGAGMWAAAGRVRVAMREKGLVKISGESAVEVDGTMSEFKCDDRSHPASTDIYEMMSMLEMVSKEGEVESMNEVAFIGCELDQV